MKKTILVALTTILISGSALAFTPNRVTRGHGAPVKEMRRDVPGHPNGPHGTPMKKAPSYKYGHPGSPKAGEYRRMSNRRPERAMMMDIPIADRNKVVAMTHYLKELNFDKDRLNAAKEFVRKNAVYTHDLTIIAESFEFDENRLEFLKTAYFTCPDKGNYMLLKKSFKFESNYNALIEFISRI